MRAVSFKRWLGGGAGSFLTSASKCHQGLLAFGHRSGSKWFNILSMQGEGQVTCDANDHNAAHHGRCLRRWALGRRLVGAGPLDPPSSNATDLHEGLGFFPLASSLAHAVYDRVSEMLKSGSLGRSDLLEINERDLNEPA